MLCPSVILCIEGQGVIIQSVKAVRMPSSPQKKEEFLLTIPEALSQQCMFKKWWLACVLQTYSDTSGVKLTFLKPARPNPFFVCPSQLDIFNGTKFRYAELVDPVTTRSGRTYYLSNKESNKATKCLQFRLNM